MFSHAPQNYSCPFCLLLDGVENEQVYSVQSDIIYHDRSVTAFVSSHQWPQNPGNTIVIPNQHFENIFDLPDQFAESIQRAARLVALAMKSVYACDGISMRQHNEPAGDQDVWHYHVHITPRFVDDQFYTNYQQKMFMPVNERAEHAEKLRTALNK